MSQSQLRHLGDNFLYWSGFTLHFCVMRRGPSASECVCVCGCELCLAFQHSVSVQPGVVLLRCRHERTDCMCWVWRDILRSAKVRLSCSSAFKSVLMCMKWGLRWNNTQTNDIRIFKNCFLHTEAQRLFYILFFSPVSFWICAVAPQVYHAILDSVVPASSVEMMQIVDGYF